MSDSSQKEEGGPAAVDLEETTVVLATGMAAQAPQAPAVRPLPSSWPAALSEQDSSVSPGRIVANRYTVLQPLGQGGMGVVMAAYDALLDRRVALKLLQPQAMPTTPQESAQARLLLEAKAMARLNHPNVVHVYDAGTLPDNRIFVAMEMVEGLTLRRWSQQQPRTWREVLKVYRDAGQGLAAAHNAGLIHRDFKPDNVLVGRDGRVRVMDFGVARITPPTSTPPNTPPAPPQPSTPAMVPVEVGDSRLTRPGTVPGTPRYMAPEILKGQTADARSDMFAFCVALYEDLYHQPPFAGLTQEERSRAQREGRVSPPPSQSKVPAWVGRAVMQGLAPDPEQRPATMEALLESLSRSPTQARTRWLALISPLVVVLGLSGWALAVWRMRTTERLQQCQGAPQRMEGVWDEALKEKVQRSFTATGKPYARDALASVQQAMDAYAQDWVGMYKEACEATRLRGEQSEQVLTLRMACLERRLMEMEALGKLFVQADGAVVQQAAQAARGLPSLKGCADMEALLSEVPLPEQPDKRRAVEGLRQELARGRALLLGGRYKEASDTARGAVARARTLDSPAVLAESLLELCSSIYRLDMKAALEPCTEAVWTANAHHQERIATRASIYLIRFLNEEGQHEQAQWWQQYASSMLERLHHPPALEAPYLGAVAIGHTQRGDGRQALQTFDRYRLLSARIYGPDDLETLTAENNAAVSLDMLGHHAEAARLLEHSARRFERLLGPHHPGLAVRLLNLAGAQAYTGDLQKARSALERSERILRESVPAGSRYYAAWNTSASAVELAQGRYEVAIRYARESLELNGRLSMQQGMEVPTSKRLLGLALLKHGRTREALEVLQQAAHSAEQQKGKGNAELALYWSTAAAAHLALGQTQEALRLCERGLRHASQQGGGQSPWTALARLDLANTLLAFNRHPEALEQAQQAHPSVLELFGPKAPRLVQSLLVQGEALLALSRPAEALAPLEQAVQVAQASGLDPNERARARLLLARTLAELGLQPERQGLLLAQARDDYTRTSSPNVAQRAELERWAQPRKLAPPTP